MGFSRDFLIAKDKKLLSKDNFFTSRDIFLLFFVFRRNISCPIKVKKALKNV